jgi:hypothetical protein
MKDAVRWLPAVALLARARRGIVPAVYLHLHTMAALLTFDLEIESRLDCSRPSPVHRPEAHNYPTVYLGVYLGVH